MAGDVRQRLPQGGNQLIADVIGHSRVDETVEHDVRFETERSCRIASDGDEAFSDLTHERATRLQAEDGSPYVADGPVDLCDRSFDALDRRRVGRVHERRLEGESDREEPLDDGVVKVTGDAFSLVDDCEFLLGDAKGFGFAPPIGHVPNDCDDVRRAVASARAETDLDREFVAGLPESAQVEPGSHRPGARVQAVAVALVNVLVAKGDRHQGLDGGADELVGGVAEHVEDPGIRDDDRSRRVDDQDAIGCGMERLPQRVDAGLAVGRNLFGAFHGRNLPTAKPRSPNDRSASMDAVQRSAVELARDLRTNNVSATEAARSLLDRVDECARTIGGVADVDADRTLAQAAESDARLRAGEARALEGVPFTVKDWIDVAGWRVTGETKQRERRPSTDAPAVARMREVGAVVLAVTTALADSPLHGETRNPRDPTRAPGGSSSGAAALVGAGASPIALGSDSGGSIRLPAAWCGVAGLRPTFGRVPLTGHMPRLGAMSDSRTVIGPITNTVDDLALVLELISGPDGHDAAMPPVGLGRMDIVVIDQLRIGYLAGSFEHPAVQPAIGALAARGAHIVERPVADVREEALDLTRRYWIRHTLSGVENTRLLWEWDVFRRRMLEATSELDVIVTPATDTAAPPWRESIDTDYVWQLPSSLTGAPSVVIPVAADEDGMPLAAQLIAQPWQEHVALAAARAVESLVSF